MYVNVCVCVCVSIILNVSNELQYIISFELITIQVLRAQSNEQYYVNVKVNAK